MVVQWKKVFAVLLPVALIGNIIYKTNLSQSVNGILIAEIINFFAEEISFPLFIVKVVSVSIALLAGSVLFADRLEVRK